MRLLCKRTKVLSVVPQVGSALVSFAVENIPTFERISKVEAQSKQNIRYSQKGFEVVLVHAESADALECLIAVLKCLEGEEE